MVKRLGTFILLVLAIAACTTPTADLKVTSLSPGPDATDVAIGSAITATFNVNVAEASLDGNFVLSKGGEVVPGVITYDASSRTATFTPDADLEYATVYTGTVSGDVRTPAGTMLGGEASWSFTTEAAPTPGEAVSSVVINQGDQALAVGDGAQLSVTVTASGGANEAVTWSSSDVGVATVSATGLVEAVAVGSATITATSVFDPTVSDSITVTVVLPEVTSVVIDQDDLALAVDDDAQLSVTVIATGNASQAVTWSSDDVGIATVDATTGLVNAVAVGSATITATSVFDPTVSDSITVTVSVVVPAVTSVVIDQDDLALVVGDTEQLSVTVTATGGASEAVTWSSSDVGVATVSATGLVEAVAVGSATITATSVFDPTVSDSITVTVTAGPAVTSVVIDQADLALVVGDTEQLSVTVTATGGASEAVTWSSSDVGVATVSATGLVEAVAVGSATITATSVFDPTVSDSITVTVTATAGTGTATAFLQGTYVSMANLSVAAPDTTAGTRIVEFDIAWDESWRGTLRPTWVDASNNWDAAWVFVKYSVDDGPWQHATLDTLGHTVPANAEIDTPSDGTGVFIYRSADGYGTFSAGGVGLVWDYATDGVGSSADVDLRLFAVEMVYVPQGSFVLGSGGNLTGEFREGGTVNTPFVVTSQSTITLGDVGGQLFWTEGGTTGVPTGTTNASFPTGFEAAYFMKYQLTQGQYVDFLNTLTQTQADTRMYPFAANPLFQYRYDVDGSAVGLYTTGVPYLPMNWISWADGAAYADWAGLRPMSELEYEKAARGTIDPVAGEYAWGSTVIAAATSLLNAGLVNETPQPGGANAAYGDLLTPNGPVRVGSFAAVGRTRVEAGASFYGLLELTGNLSERPVTVGNAQGRSFTGAHGDGALDATGNATVSGWPGNADALGAGFRGGTHFIANELLRISSRVEASSITAGRAGVYGWRGARSAP